MVRAENYMRAILYARRYLSPWGATHMKELQQVMATLAVRSNTECAKYKVNLIPPSNGLLVQVSLVACYAYYWNDWLTTAILLFLHK